MHFLSSVSRHFWSFSCDSLSFDDVKLQNCHWSDFEVFSSISLFRFHLQLATAIQSSWKMPSNDDHSSEIRVTSNWIIHCTSSRRYVLTLHSYRQKSAISLLISPRQIMHFSRKQGERMKKLAKRRRMRKSFEHYVTSISQTLVSITLLSLSLFGHDWTSRIIQRLIDQSPGKSRKSLCKFPKEQHHHRAILVKGKLWWKNLHLNGKKSRVAHKSYFV